MKLIRLLSILVFGLVSASLLAQSTPLWVDVYNKGIDERNKGNFQAANNYFVRAYELGDKIFSPCRIGDLYYYGLGVEKDLSKSFLWYKIAAVAGGEEGMYLTAIAYDGGLGVDQNKKEAAVWYKKVVGYNKEYKALAANNLGSILEGGEIDGVPQKEEAGKYYKIAAEGGIENAQFAVGMFYLLGINGFPKNQQQAVYWLKKSAAQGFTRAQIQLAKMGY